MADTNYTDELNSYIDIYSGRQDSKAFVQERIDAANIHMDTAAAVLTNTSAALGSLLAESEATTDSISSSVSAFDVSAPDFTKEKLDVDPPEAPASAPLGEVSISNPGSGTWAPEDVALPGRPTTEASDLSEFGLVSKPDAGLIAAPNLGEFTFDLAAYNEGLIDFIRQEISLALRDEADLAELTPSVDLNGNLGGVPLVDPDIERAIYNRASARRLANENREVLAVETQFQSRGFSAPPGALTAAITDIRRAALLSEEDLNNDIMQKSLELEQKRTEYELQKAAQLTDAQSKYDATLIQIASVNLEFKKAIVQNKAVLIDSATKLESVQGEIYKARETLRLDASKTDFSSSLELYNTKVEAYKNLVQAYQVENEVVQAKVKAVSEYNSGLIDIYAKEVEAAKVSAEVQKISVDGTKVLSESAALDVQAQVETAKAENERMQATAQIFESEVKAYASLIDGLKAAELGDVQRYEAEARGKAAEISAQASVAQAEVEAGIRRMAVEIELLKSQANVSASIVSSALNSIHTSSSYGFSGHSGKNSSSALNRGISYSYSGSVDSSPPAAT